MSDPYPGSIITKYECVGRDLKARYEVIPLKDNKFIGGLGRLNEKPMNTLHNYYGKAICQNSELYAMKKSVAAVVHHCLEASTMEERHELLKPIFGHHVDLGSDQLLSKCLHGFTQNVHEALHIVIW